MGQPTPKYVKEGGVPLIKQPFPHVFFASGQIKVREGSPLEVFLLVGIVFLYQPRYHKKGHSSQRESNTWPFCYFWVLGGLLETT